MDVLVMSCSKRCMKACCVLSADFDAERCNVLLFYSYLSDSTQRHMAHVIPVKQRLHGMTLSHKIQTMMKDAHVVHRCMGMRIGSYMLCAADVQLGVSRWPQPCNAQTVRPFSSVNCTNHVNHKPQTTNHVAGCQMSLAPRSDLWLGALPTQGRSASLMLGALEIAAKIDACCVFVL